MISKEGARGWGIDGQWCGFNGDKVVAGNRTRGGVRTGKSILADGAMSRWCFGAGGAMILVVQKHQR